MLGTLHVGPLDQASSEQTQGVSIVRNPADVPPPVGDRELTTVRIDLTTREVTGRLADGATYYYFTFDGQIPGPMIRVRVGDTVEIHLANDASSQFLTLSICMRQRALGRCSSDAN
jgi:nitrite reductase (NO-forming)